jgi:Zn finger protein HypA/HybF involved in hydrogenase expression
MSQDNVRRVDFKNKQVDYELEMLFINEEVSDLEFEIRDRKEVHSCTECGRSYMIDGYYHPQTCEKCNILGIESVFAEQDGGDLYDILTSSER